jgi:membrane peptidoglycan carboxypeptidase
MRALGRWLLLLVMAGVCLQLFFALRILGMNWLAPESTSFQRSQAWQILVREGQLSWRQETVALQAMSKGLQRAVIASEDAARLNAWEAARLAVMLPRPRYFEKLAQSAYLARRAETIMARMNDVVLP